VDPDPAPDPPAEPDPAEPTPAGPMTAADAWPLIQKIVS